MPKSRRTEVVCGEPVDAVSEVVIACSLKGEADSPGIFYGITEHTLRLSARTVSKL
ncbi:hypothetical protein HMPREF0201_03259 [Cedecea davisae DSM 4568]|uniref:Uncharacterized protein n=1 Tax=Cedecea davisae DSM 4568 TaxID=566551 RepID=S3ISS7_9ENTR|nr:hypothetical protein HMPREF0201_03259 [Cedecea davisae DSM 4568]